MENQVDFKILPSDQFNVYSPATRSDKIITYFTLLSKLRGDILAVSSQEDPNNIVSAYYTNVGNTQTLHLVKGDGSEVTASNSFAGTVTSVDMSVPTGFAISGNPITTSGTLNVSFASGYSLPTDALQATWTTAYNRSITSAAVTGTSTKTLTLNQQDGGTVTASWTDQGLTSVGLTMPAAFNVANSPLTSNGTIAVTAAGLSSQYIRGDGQLANFPSGGGGGSAVNYYLNGSVNQGTFGGTTYYQMSRTPISGAGTNFTRTSAQGDGYVASFITDAGDPDLLNIPGGNWNLEFYFNSSSSGGAPAFYGDLYKVSASNVFTLISSGSTNAEIISGGTTVDQYYTSIAVPQTTLLSTDRLAIRVYVIVDGRNITLHTEDNNFSEVITTFSTGLNALNGLTDQVQYFATGTSGTDFNISSATDTHTFNIPTASGTNRGLLSSSDWTTFNNKASDSFKTIAVSGQSDVVADSATDTLTFEAGTNIVITTDAATDKITINALGGGSGSVTSVDMSVPTGFAISGNPITTSGTLALAFASGYSLPTNASQTNWNTAYDNSITAFAYNTSTGVLTLTQQDAGTLTATVTLQPFTTDNLTQGSTNLYDKVVSLTGAGTTVVTGTYPNFTITSNDQHAGTVTSIATSAPITGGTITTIGTIGITQSGAAADGYLSSTDWNTFNSKVGGSGTINYVSKWTSTGAIGNSQIFDSGTYVGINTATPAAKLDISGAHVASIGLLRLNSSAANVAAQTYYIDGVYKAATYAGTDDNFYILGRDADIVFSTTSSTTTRMVITNGGNVGIGTSVPTQKLMVSGSIRVTGGYYDSSNSIGSNGQVLASTGSGTTWINASGGTVNGSGTVNYIPKWTGTTLLADSQLFDNGTNVGVGTATPNRKLTVSGNGTLLGLQSSTAGGYSEMEFTADGVSGAYIFKLSSGNSSYAGAGSLNIYNSGAIGFHTASVSNAMFIASATGNVGLGNTGPSQKLHVEGNIRVTGAYYDSANVAGSSGQVLSSTGSGTSWITPFSGSGTTNYVAKWTSGTAIGNSSIYDNGNVGIGTTAPNTKLRIQESGTNPPLAIQNTNADGYSGAWLYNSAGTLVGHFGWGNGTTTALSDKMYFGSIASKDIVFTTSDTEKVRITSGGNVGIGTTNPSRLLHVAGNAQVDGWLFQGGYYTGSVTLPYPGANYGNGRIYLRLCSSASGRIMTAKVRISSTWNWAPAFGSVEADISFYWNGSSLVYSYVNILSATGQAATNLTFGALEVEGGSISVPVYSTNSNPIYAYIQLSPDADPSQVSYSTWSSVAFPGQANVYIQTNLGLGTSSPGYRLDINGVARFQDQVRFKTDIWQISDSDGRNRFYFSPGGRTYFGSGDGYEWRSSSDTAIAVITNGGNLGINETAPSQKLHVSGNVRVTGAYYDSSNAAGTSGQILSSTGTGTAWISPGGGGGIITGSGTTNYVTKWTGTSAVGDSSIFDNGSVVSVGTASPYSGLSTRLYVGYAQNSSVVNQNEFISVGAAGGSTNQAGINFLIYNAGYGGRIYTDDNTVRGLAFDVLQNGTFYNAISITRTTSPNVGIGTTAPQKPLEVISGVNDFVSVGVNQISVGNWTGIHFGYREANSLYRKSAIVFERTDLTANDAQGKIHILNGPQGSNGSATLADAKLTIAENGNVGIGTTSPLKKLVVTTGNNTNSSSNKSDALAYFGGGNDNPNAQNISFPNPSITDLSIPGMYWWSADVMFGRYKNEAFWSIKETHGGALGGSQRDIIRSYFYDSGGYTYIDKTVIPNGNVGIGTTAPGNKLAILAPDTTGVPTLGTNQGHFGIFNGNLGGSYGLLAGIINNGNAYLEVQRIDGNATAYNMLLQPSGGNVGIGTTAPGAKLDVRFDDGVSNGEHNVLASFSRNGSGPLVIGYRANGTSVTSALIRIGDGLPLTIGTTSSNQAFTLLDNGNVGIGTTAPSQLLHVSGNIRVTGAYYDSANGAGTSGQILSSTGTGTAWIAAPSGGITGSGTTNYVAKWTSGSAVGNSSIYDNGNVGIGTPAPESLLHLSQASTGGDGAFLFIDNPASSTLGNTAGIRFATNAGASFSGYGSFIQAVNTNAGNGAESLTFGTWNGAARGERMRIDSSGSVGINTTNPAYKLDVIGSVRSYSGLISNGYHADTYIENLLPAANNGAGQGDVQLRMWCSEPGITWSWAGFGYNVKNDGASPYGFGRVNTSFGQAYMRFSTDGNLYFYNANTSGTRVETMTLTNGGNVGIGTTAPTFKLDVRDGTNAIVRVLDTSTNNSLIMQAGTGAGMKITGYNYNTSTAVPLYISVDGANTIMQTGGGNVGIGTTAPVVKLHVADSGGGRLILQGVGGSGINWQLNSYTDGKLYIGNYGVADYVTLTSAGNVGIGTLAPSSKLTVTTSNRSFEDGENAIRIEYPGSPSNGEIGGGLVFAQRWFSGAPDSLIRTGGIYGVKTNGNGAFGGGLVFYTQPNSGDPMNEHMRITSAGNVGIGTTAPAEKLSVVGNIRSAGNVIASVGLGYGNYISMRHDDVNGYITITRTVYAGNLILEPYANVGISTTNPSYKLDVSGTIRATGDVIAYSDARVKENVETLDGALDKVMKMRGVSYNKIGEQEKKVGVIAQEILEVLPEVVSQDESGTYSVAYGNISAVLIEAIKELTNTVKEQQKQIDELKAKLK